MERWTAPIATRRGCHVASLGFISGGRIPQLPAVSDGSTASARLLSGRGCLAYRWCPRHPSPASRCPSERLPLGALVPIRREPPDLPMRRQRTRLYLAERSLRPEHAAPERTPDSIRLRELPAVLRPVRVFVVRWRSDVAAPNGSAHRERLDINELRGRTLVSEDRLRRQ